LNNIIKRKFPYTFKAALAICTDVDGTTSAEKYVGIQKYLCSDRNTELGEGLNLETGNSFWFFRNSSDAGISYFHELSLKETNFAGIIRDLIRAGYVDVLHTYGDFNNGGFSRKHAEICINEMSRRNMTVPTWVNHGNNNNSQNLGDIKGYEGDLPGSSSYHLDLLREAGIEYFWLSQITHLVGQDSGFTINNFLKNQLQKVLAIKYGKRQIKPFFTNKLMDKILLRDGTYVNAFQRYINPWGKYSYTDINNIPFQINDKILKELINNTGYLILYTHLGNNPRNNEWIPYETKLVLEKLAGQYKDGNIFITTTSRLLRYYETWNNLDYDITAKDSGVFEINIRSNSGTHTNNFDGITFYTDYPDRTIIKLNGIELTTTQNNPDYTGRNSISVPWVKLEFPL
jgi:hypothetical protein